MRTRKEIKNHPKNNDAHYENLGTQAFKTYEVFNNPKVSTESWYPLLKSKKLNKKQATSVSILNQRIALYRGESGKVYALDAFCPHMGADLGNGIVEKEKLKCFFHHWSFDSKGETKSFNGATKKCLQTYPVEEKFGFIWVFAAERTSYSLPNPPGLQEKESEALHLKTVKLFAHHHVMMVGGIDLQHFKSVHNLDIKFDFSVSHSDSDTYTWKLSGKLPSKTLMQKLARYITGGEFKYEAVFSGGTVTSLSYGTDLTWRGKGKTKLPQFHLYWGARPLEEGVSEVEVFCVVKKYKGFFGFFKKNLSYFFSFVLLWALSDDDVKAFPNMRFQLGMLKKEDRSVLRLAQLLEKLKISNWSKKEIQETSIKPEFKYEQDQIFID